MGTMASMASLRVIDILSGVGIHSCGILYVVYNILHCDAGEIFCLTGVYVLAALYLEKRYINETIKELCGIPNLRNLFFELYMHLFFWFVSQAMSSNSYIVYAARILSMLGIGRTWDDLDKHIQRMDFLSDFVEVDIPGNFFKVKTNEKVSEKDVKNEK